LLVHAEHFASSHADRFVTHALPNKYRPTRYAFTFLQHGVIKGDLSLWLNPKNIDVFVTSTEDEYEYITGTSPYRFGRKETRLTGLPRFDVLKLRRDAVPEEERDIILVMPTWRDYLVGTMSSASNDRETIDGFEETVYSRSLSNLLLSDRLAKVAQASRRRVVFMPHPNMHRYLDRFTIPDYVETVSYADVDVRDMLAHAILLVTDYSSTAFNAAYLDIPVVYYQFDKEEYLAGHTERAGYFSYETHGFGPITTTTDDAVAAIESALEGNSDIAYSHRVTQTFPVRDGKNRLRVYEAMRAASAREPLRSRVHSAPGDDWDTDGSNYLNNP